jgi:hypothetical protein
MRGDVFELNSGFLRSLLGALRLELLDWKRHGHTTARLILFSISKFPFQCHFRSSSRVNIKDQLTCQNIKSKGAGGIHTCRHDSLSRQRH